MDTEKDTVIFCACVFVLFFSLIFAHRRPAYWVALALMLVSAIIVIILYNTKEKSNGRAIHLERLAVKTEFEMLCQEFAGSRWVAIVRKPEENETWTVHAKEKLPKRFELKSAGWMSWGRRTIVPLREPPKKEDP